MIEISFPTFIGLFFLIALIGAGGLMLLDWIMARRDAGRRR